MTTIPTFTFLSKGENSLLEKVTIVVAEKFDITTEELFSTHDRKEYHVMIRRAISVFLWKKTKIPLKKIGKIWGRDHSTIIVYINNHEQVMKQDSRYSMVKDQEYQKQYLASAEKLQGFHCLSKLNLFKKKTRRFEAQLEEINEGKTKMPTLSKVLNLFAAHLGHTNVEHKIDEFFEKNLLFNQARHIVIGN